MASGLNIEVCHSIQNKNQNYIFSVKVPAVEIPLKPKNHDLLTGEGDGPVRPNNVGLSLYLRFITISVRRWRKISMTEVSRCSWLIMMWSFPPASSVSGDDN